MILAFLLRGPIAIKKPQTFPKEKFEASLMFNKT